MKAAVTRHSPSTGPDSPDVWGVYEPDSGTVQYVVACPTTKACALIDIVTQLDTRSFSTSSDAAEHVAALVETEGLTVEWVLDTHPHADHLTASRALADRFEAMNGIGEKVREIAELWRGFYHLPAAFEVARDFDRLFAEGDTFAIGDLNAKVWLSPGHTLGSISFLVGSDAALVHDTLMYPDSGTSRCDFPGGSAADLWDSIQRILSLPEDTRLFVGHDYGKGARAEPMWEATVAAHKHDNIHVRDGTVREDWIAIREARDATLALPDRMLAALQINLRAGRLPPTEDDGHAYLKIPLNRF